MMNRVWTGIMIVICMAALTGCHHAGSNRTADTYSIEQIEELENDTKTLESALTKEYDLNELRSFFKDSRANESIGFGSAKPALMFREVDHRYPVEILRTGGYSVYRVRQGGYFYVFGSRLLPEMQTGQMVSRLCISAHIWPPTYLRICLIP